MQGRTIKFQMTEPQARFFQMEDKYPAFVGGFGSGKTEVMANSAIRDALHAHDALVALYEPTYDLVNLILIPRLEEKLSEQGFRFKTNKKDYTIYTSSTGIGDFILRTLDNPARIVGYESYRSHVDELDTLPAKKAREAWQKIIARNRQSPSTHEKPFNRVSAYTTPEGFRFVYDRWVKNPAPGYAMIQAPTSSNPFLPDDYISSLRDSYPPELIDAYLDGRFTNLVSGNVYASFSRSLNHSSETERPNEVLHVGMDFNVLNMHASINVMRDGLPITTSEVVKVRDTPEMCRVLKERFSGHQIIVYPDASGNSKSSKSASESDISILREAGFKIRVDSRNPAVKDRVNAMNGMILNSSGERRWMVNTDRCPTLTESLEQQAYAESGEPDKSTGHDHMNDAQGYFIVNRFPVKRPQTGVQRIRGLA